MARKVLIPFILFLALLGFSLISILHFFHIQELPKESIGVVLDDVISNTIPSKDDDYWFSSATCTNQGSASWDGVKWRLKLKNVTQTRTKCNLKFSKTMNIRLHSTMGSFTDSTLEKTVTISKANVSTELENIIKPTYGSAKYLFLSYNSKEDGTGVTLSYESLLQGITEYYAVWKKNFATISIGSPNSLPTYNSSDFFYANNIYVGSGGSVRVYQNAHETTLLNYTFDPAFQINAFFLIVYQKNTNTELLRLFNTVNEQITTFNLDSGWYTLETRLNGSKNDLKHYSDFYFEKGKKYKVRAIIEKISANTNWKVSNLGLYEVYEPVEILLGEKFTKPNITFYKPGYTIGESWYTDYERTKLFDFNTPITQDMTLYPGLVKNS